MTSETPLSRRDWLLTSARVLVTIFMVAVCVAGFGLLAAAIAAPVFQDKILTEIASETGKQYGGEIIVAAELIFAIIAAMGVCAFQWLRQLRRIIDSVGQGEAFAPENAERLANMGWLTVGVEALSVPAGVVAAYVAKHTHSSHIDLGFSLNGILLALVLFILARVFREGARMREELEGTV
jgi:hypothetical protein